MGKSVGAEQRHPQYKYHGLTDKALCYRLRYLISWLMQSHVSVFSSVARLFRRCENPLVRDFEVETP